ncbi:MAG: hypothetical protein ACFFEA_10230 [Candidatus Thorarchaeota archaeon]
MSNEGIRSPVNFKLESMMDLARMLASSGQANRPASLLYFKHKGKHIYGTLISHHGYYELYGVPLWVYTEGEGPPDGSYLSYTNRDKEAYEFTSTPSMEPRVAYMPVIKLAEKLAIIDL